MDLEENPSLPLLPDDLQPVFEQGWLRALLYFFAFVVVALIFQSLSLLLLSVRTGEGITPLTEAMDTSEGVHFFTYIQAFSLVGTRLFAFRRLADHALSLKDEDAVQIILTRACDMPAADWKMVQEFIRLSRIQGQKNVALVTLGHWIDRQGREKKTDEITEARRLYASLLLRSDRAEEALAHLLEILKTVPTDHILPAKDLELALVCARSAEQSLVMQPG